ncbi:MAG: SLBB domain-containing protein [Bacteroidales bacterium]|nr:SLBB domain-containing protein [Bacteroidales bacterium]
MKKFFMAFVAVLMSLTLFAQSANMLQMARAELDKRGLNEQEVRERLMANGINVDTIQPSEYASYQGRVMAILNQMQAEKAGAKAAASTGNAAANTGGEQTVVVEEVPPVSPADVPQTTMGEAAAEAALEKALDDNKVSPTEGNDIYGHSLFTGKALDVFRTTDGAQAPDTYVLGEGDEVHISIFGSSQTEIHQRIAVDGSIQPAGSTKIFLKGMTLAQARAAIRSKLSQHYSFRPDQIAVTITTARTLTVSIYGEVGVQGGFTLSALNTAFNALAAAGGPTRKGSVRNIQLSRAGKVSRLDLYAYITNPTVGLPYDLQNNDVFFVPIAQKVVSIEGAVQRPMRYEMIEGESLIDLINYAGGLTYNAYPEFVQVERFNDGEVKLMEYNLSSVISGKQKVDLVAGDIVRVKPSNRPVENYVEISGDVYYGGRFDLVGNSSLKALIEKAQPRYTAKKDFVFVERHNADETVEVITVPFPGENGNPDFTLLARDAVRVLELSGYRDVETLSVQGQVRRPFSREFGLNDRMTVSQAIEYAGGLKPNVYPVAYIVRKDLSNPDKREYIRVSLESDGNTLLRAGDQLKVYDNTTYTNIGEVRISGAVKKPLGTPYDATLSVKDMITMAGGFTLGAAYNRVEVFRLNISETEQVKYEMVTLAVDEDYNLKNADFQLQPFDHIVVRMTPNFGTSRVVELSGRVKYPGTYVLQDSRTHLSQIIEMAGGVLDDADPNIWVFRTYKNRGNIGMSLKAMARHKRQLAADPILMDGDVINIVRQENTVVIRSLGTLMDQYVPDEFMGSQKIMIYQGGHDAGWYIRHYAGGFDRNADRNSVTVTMPNYQTESTQRFLGMRNYPKVQPGSVITLRMSPEKIKKEEEPQKKVDLETVAAKTLTSVTSIISIVILSKNLKNM